MNITFRNLRQAFCLAAVFALMLFGFSVRLRAQSLGLGDRFSLITAEGPYQFQSQLFSLDQGLKEYPHSLSGLGASGTFAVQLTKEFAVTLQGVENKASGSGSWLDTGVMTAAEAAYAPVATGKTTLKLRGGLIGIRKDFGDQRVIPYIEAGVGYGMVHVKFNGTASAIDPSDSQPFTTAASDSICRDIPFATLGAGAQIPIRRGSGLFLVTGVKWDEGPEVIAGMRYYLFRHTR